MTLTPGKRHPTAEEIHDRQFLRIFFTGFILMDITIIWWVHISGVGLFAALALLFLATLFVIVRYPTLHPNSLIYGDPTDQQTAGSA